MKPGDKALLSLHSYGQSKPLVNEAIESKYPASVTFEVYVWLGSAIGEQRLVQFILATVDPTLVPAGYKWDVKIEERDEAGVTRLVTDHLLCSPRSGLNKAVAGHHGRTLVFTVSQTKGAVTRLFRYFPRLKFTALGASPSGGYDEIIPNPAI